MPVKSYSEYLPLFPSLKWLLKVQSDIPYEKFQQIKFKKAHMTNEYSCCTYVNNRPNLMR